MTLKQLPCGVSHDALGNQQAPTRGLFSMTPKQAWHISIATKASLEVTCYSLSCLQDPQLRGYHIDCIF